MPGQPVRAMGVGTQLSGSLPVGFPWAGGGVEGVGITYGKSYASRSGENVERIISCVMRRPGPVN